MSSESPISDTPPQQSLALELTQLRQALASLQEEKNSLEILVDIVTDHSTNLEKALELQNREMAEYIQQVKTVTAAARAVQQGSFTPEHLTSVAARPDALGNLAHVFTETVQSVKAQAQKLLEANQHLEKLLQAYSRFVPHEYLKFLQRESVINVQLGDHVSKEMAIMFSDIRDFTRLSEQMTPQAVFDLVNTYLSHVSPEIRKHRGFIVKYLGDGMMAVFPDRVDDALQAAIAKVKRLQEYNQQRQTQGLTPLQVGIGIHVGHMMVGMVGEANRMGGDVLSDNVNLTARLEGLTKYYGVAVIISEEVLLKLTQPDHYAVRLLDRAIVKGRQQPITVYEMLDAEVEATRSLKLQTLPIYQQGLQLYQQGSLSQAKACFEQVLQANPTDKTVQLYLQRIQQLYQQGKPQPWDGVWVFTQK